MSEKNYVLGIDIGGTNIRTGLVDKDYNIYNFTIENSDQFMTENGAVEKLVKYVSNYIEQHKNFGNITAISIGFPSTIDITRKIVLSTPNIIGFNNVNIVDDFENTLGIKTYINRDVNMIMLFDMHNQKISNTGVAVGFYLGTGLGNAISINGNLLVGKNGSAAELGHIPTRNHDQPCGCGNIGCMETFASGKYLRTLCKEQLDNVHISEVFLKYSDHKVIEKYIEDLALPICAEINILDPDYIILGGGVIQMDGFPRKKLEDSIYKFARKPYPAETLELFYSNTGQESGVVGAGIYAFKMLNA